MGRSRTKKKGGQQNRVRSSSVTRELAGARDKLAKADEKLERERADSSRRWVLEAVVSGRVLRELATDATADRFPSLAERVLRELALEEDAETLLRIDHRRRLVDKHSVPPARVPCSENIHICQGACCYKPTFPLTLQDIAEGTVKFNLKDPFTIALADDGFCIHFDRETYQCSIREHRPAICRQFNCLTIRGWWEHFRKGIPGPKLLARLEKIKQSDPEAATEEIVSTIQTAAKVDLGTDAYHVFGGDGERFFYDLGTGNISQINEVAHDILNDGGDGSRALSKHPREEVHAALKDIERLKLMGYFRGYEIPGLEKRREIHESLWRHHPRSLFFYVSQACNMQCAYCYAQNNGANDVGKLATFEQAKRVVDHLVRVSGRRPYLSITFFGGEPLLNFRVVEATVKYCLSLEKDKKKKFDFRLSTNGTLLNKEIISFLVKHQFGMLVSLDGPPEVHDRIRRMRDGSPSHAITFEKAKALCEAFGDPGWVKIRANLTRLAPDVGEIVDYLAGCGFQKIGISDVLDTPSGNSDLSVTPEQAEKNYAWRLAQIPAFLRSLVSGRRLPYNPWALTLREFGHGGGIRGPSCGVGRNSNGISCDGTIYPCHRFVGMEGFALGNVRTGLNRKRVMEFYKKCADTASADECARCWARRFCKGGCPWERAVPGGDFISSAKESCQRGLEGLETCMRLYVKVRETVPEFFDRPGELSEALPEDGVRPLSW